MVNELEADRDDPEGAKAERAWAEAATARAKEVRRLEAEVRARSMAAPLYAEHQDLTQLMFIRELTAEEARRLGHVRTQLDEIETRHGQHWERLRDALEEHKVEVKRLRACLRDVVRWAEKAQCPDGCRGRHDYNGVSPHDSDCEFGIALGNARATLKSETST